MKIQVLNAPNKNYDKYLYEHYEEPLYFNNKAKFAYTHPHELSEYLWGCTWYHRELKQWGDACLQTFKSLPEIPAPVSASQVAKQMNVSHVTAKVRMLKSDGWIQISTKWFIKKTTLPRALVNAIIESKSPLYLTKLINQVRKDISTVPTFANLSEIIGQHGIQTLRESGLIKSLQLFSSVQHLYYVPAKYIILL